MSGPKCIEIRRVPRVQARRMNQEFCLSKLSWLERIGDELRQLDERLIEVGLIAENHVPDVQALAHDVERMLCKDEGLEAAQHCLAAAEAAEQTLSTAQERLRQRVAELHQRFRELEVARQRILSDRESLGQLVGAMVPADWPEAEQRRVKEKVGVVLDEALVPDAVEPELTRGAISRLAQAEPEAAARLSALADGRRGIEALINTTHARLLTERLTPGIAKLPTLDEYLKTHARSQAETTASAARPDKVAAKLDGLLSEIVMLEHTAIWPDICRRARLIREEPDGERQRMLYDALVVECSGHLKQLRATERFREGVHRLLDAAAPWKGTCVDGVVEELTALGRSGAVVDLQEIEGRLNRAIDQARKDLEREEKHRAIVQALADMGYTAREGMQTALVRDGKCIVRRAGDDDYGVELSADRDLTMVETELVRFVGDESDRPTQQQELADVRREEAWCEDYKQARELLAAKYGWQAELRYQLKPGQQPVKRVVEEAKRKAAATKAQSENRQISGRDQPPE